MHEEEENFGTQFDSINGIFFRDIPLVNVDPLWI